MLISKKAAVLAVLAVTMLTLVAPAAAETGVSNGRTYTVTATNLAGVTPDHMARWTADILQLSDGDHAVVAAFNSASRASAQGQIDKFIADRPGNWESTLEATGEATFRNIAIAQLIRSVIVWSALHPPNWVSTVVIDSRTAQPITLADLFADEQAGLARLSAQSKTLIADQYGDDLPQQILDRGTAPREANFANWIPTAAGMEIHFDEYQFDGPPFARVILVPWSALTDVLAPDMQPLAES